MTMLQCYRMPDLRGSSRPIRPSVSIAPVTGPMSLLAGRKALVLAGSTSSRLDARRNAAIAANIEVGLDVLRPHSPGAYAHFRRSFRNQKGVPACGGSF
jgi:hypothetical protein